MCKIVQIIPYYLSSNHFYKSFKKAGIIFLGNFTKTFVTVFNEMNYARFVNTAFYVSFIMSIYSKVEYLLLLKSHGKLSYEYTEQTEQYDHFSFYWIGGVLRYSIFDNYLGADNVI